VTMAKRSKSKVREASSWPGPVSLAEPPGLGARLTTAVVRAIVPRWLQRSSIVRLVGYILAWRKVRLHPLATSHNNSVQGIDKPARGEASNCGNWGQHYFLTGSSTLKIISEQYFV
jgi:hypothetical protein